MHLESYQKHIFKKLNFPSSSYAKKILKQLPYNKVAEGAGGHWAYCLLMFKLWVTYFSLNMSQMKIRLGFRLKSDEISNAQYPQVSLPSHEKQISNFNLKKLILI